MGTYTRPLEYSIVNHVAWNHTNTLIFDSQKLEDADIELSAPEDLDTAVSYLLNDCIIVVFSNHFTAGTHLQ